MRDLIAYGDRSLLTRSIFDEMDKVVNDVFGKGFFPTTIKKSSYPKLNVYDEGNILKIDAYVPEVPKDKLSIEVENDILTISGRSDVSKNKETNKYYFREVSHAYFSRSLQLPENVDIENIKADHSDGMLKLTIPYKKLEEVKNNVRKVEIA